MTQNKVLPGAYINFVSRPRAMGSLGERGVVCVGMELDWGREGMTDIAAAEGRTNCRELFGYTYLSEEMKDLRELFAHAKEVKAWKVENAEKVKKWGRLQYYKRVPYTMNSAQLKEQAERILKEKCRVVKKLTVENINGDVMLFAGNTIWLEIPGLAEISLQGQVLIESCTHIFEEGAHRMQMDIRIEEVG